MFSRVSCSLNQKKLLSATILNKINGVARCPIQNNELKDTKSVHIEPWETVEFAQIITSSTPVYITHCWEKSISATFNCTVTIISRGKNTK